VSALDPRRLETQYQQLGITAQVLPFAGEVFKHYDWADVVIARAGAGTLTDLALAGVPSLLVPLADAAADHQAENAAAFAARDAALWVRESAWDSDALGRHLADLLREPARWLAMSSAARALAAPDAAAAIVHDCERVITERWPST
jgi:UDP-N-acetylglucosamine--N-acetylmuramyl-(pentapeptide) pyrophosphoryl-undecaprenol N-acetylglucosamine transferase